MTTKAGKQYKEKLLKHLLSSDWREALEGEFNKDYFNKLCDNLANEEASSEIFPPIEHVFEAFNFTPLSSVRVVIIGQDPYHDDNQAHGLCFSVQPGIKVPPSLRNMYKELEGDISDFKTPSHGYLLSWAKQGILMLNATLTVRPHKANSHKTFGWLKFTDFVISYLNKAKSNVVFALWGGFAQKIGKKVDRKKHIVLETAHPSPLSVTKWRGCKVFSKINQKLEEKGQEVIDWKLPDNPELEVPINPHIGKSANSSAQPETDEANEGNLSEDEAAAMKSEESGSDVEMESSDEETDYEQMRVPELRACCKERGLPSSGRKAELISRLQSKSTLGKRTNEDAALDKTDTPAKKQRTETESKPATVADSSNHILGSFTEDDIKSHMKIVSWNVAGWKSVTSKGFKDYVSQENPDVICLQETKIAPTAVPDDYLSGYHKYFSIGSKPGYAGTGVFTKKEPLSVTYGIGMEEHDDEGRVITCEYDEFYLITSYIPNSGRKLVRLDYRMQWDKDFFAYLKKLDEQKPIVWCGDLNVAHKEIDLTNPKTNKKNAGFTVEERESFGKFLDSGFVDLYRHHFPEEKNCYTYWSYFRAARSKNIGWRLDYFIVSQRFIDNFSTYKRAADVLGSDHCPIVTSLVPTIPERAKSATK
uniref:Uracil-DNA glycosylase n=1 Tax=Vannella robusta TaxID=1487602 RepID=A0A7S4I9H6_9EUKA